MDPVAPQDSQNLGVASPTISPLSPAPSPQDIGPLTPVISPVAPAPVEPGAPKLNVQTEEPLTSGDGENKKKVFIIGGVVLFLLLVIGAAIYFAPRITSKLAPKNQTQAVPTVTPTPIIASAKISYLEGEAWSISGEEKTPIYEDTEVTEGQTLETGEETKLEITLDGGSSRRLGSYTTITLSNLDSLDLAFSQDMGSLFAYVEKGVGRFTV